MTFVPNNFLNAGQFFLKLDCSTNIKNITPCIYDGLANAHKLGNTTRKRAMGTGWKQP